MYTFAILYSELTTLRFKNFLLLHFALLSTPNIYARYSIPYRLHKIVSTIVPLACARLRHVCRVELGTHKHFHYLHIYNNDRVSTKGLNKAVCVDDNVTQTVEFTREQIRRKNASFFLLLVSFYWL